MVGRGAGWEEGAAWGDACAWRCACRPRGQAQGADRARVVKQRGGTLVQEPQHHPRSRSSWLKLWVVLITPTHPPTHTYTPHVCQHTLCQSHLQALKTIEKNGLDSMAAEAGINLWKLPFEDARPQRLAYLAENKGKVPQVRGRPGMDPSSTRHVTASVALPVGGDPRAGSKLVHVCLFLAVMLVGPDGAFRSSNLNHLNADRTCIH